MRRYLICALAIVAMVSCKKDDSQAQTGGDNIVSFKTSNIITRTTEIEQDGVMVDAWESGDRVGITTIGFSAEYANVEYQASTSSDAATTSFSVVDADQAICYPTGESGQVTFYGYYPYTNLYEDGVITASVADQTGDIGAVDFMTASSSVSYSSGASSEDVSLEFDHALSKVIFNITLRSDVTDFTEMTVTLKDLYTTAQYELDGVQVEGSLADVADVEFTTVVADGNGSAVATGIVHPGEQGALGSSIEFNLSGRKFIINCDEPLSANYVHIFTVNIGSESAEIEGESTILPWDSLGSGDLSFLKEVWDGETIAISFSGVAYNPDLTTSYEITNGEELAYIAQLANSGDDLSDITFTMLNNIDLGGHSWTPIGFNESSETEYNFNGTFDGTFDGGGYKVKNLYVETESNQGAGLFGVLKEGGVIMNLAVEGDVYAKGNCAGVVGAVYSGEVTSCSFSGSVTSTWNYSGGIVGYLWDNGVVKGCSNSGTISAIGNNCESIGGIVGYACGSTITECYNVGDVSTDTDNVGGIVGHLAYCNYDNVTGTQGKVTLCYNSGDITTLRYNAGGIVGFCSDSYVESTYNSGTIKAGYDYSGGVVGYMWVVHPNTTAECSYSYNIGDAETAGLIGYFGDVECYVNNCVTLAYPSYSYYDVDLEIYTDISYANYSSSVEKVSNVATLSESVMRAKLLTDYLTNGDWLEDTEGVNGGFPILNGIDYN